jgi:hypothetical protein
MCNCNNSEESRFVYYVDVGQLPREKADEHLKYVAAQWRQQLPEHERRRWMFIPIRNGDSRIERI